MSYRIFINDYEISSDVVSTIQFNTSIYSPYVDGFIQLNNTSTLKYVLRYDRTQTLKLLFSDPISDEDFAFVFNINYQDISFDKNTFHGSDILKFSTYNNQMFMESSKKIYDDKIENIFDDLFKTSTYKMRKDIESTENIIHPCNNKTIDDNIQYLLKFMGDENLNGGSLLYFDILNNNMILTNLKTLLEQEPLGFPLLYPSDNDGYIGYISSLDVDFVFDQYEMSKSRIFNNIQHGFDYDKGEQIKRDASIFDTIKNVKNKTITFDKNMIDLNSNEIDLYNKSEKILDIYKSNLYWKNAINSFRFNIFCPNGSFVRRVGKIQDVILYSNDDNGTVVDDKFTTRGLITEITHIFKDGSYGQNLKVNNIGFDKETIINKYSNLVKL